LCYRNRTDEFHFSSQSDFQEAIRTFEEQLMTADVAPAATNRWLVLVIACLAQFMVVLDATIVNVALPSIQRGLHFSATNLQWVVNAYTLIFGGFLLLGGRAADLLGRKRLFMAGIAVFSLASLLNGLAQSPTMLIVGRGLQGLGGALLSPAALSIITTTFTETRERARALGVWSAIAAGGGAVGLLLGGVLTDLTSWQWIFIVNVPVGVIALIATLRWVPESRPELAHRTFDLAGACSRSSNRRRTAGARHARSGCWPRAPRSSRCLSRSNAAARRR
jgi:MFS family permease